MGAAGMERRIFLGLAAAGALAGCGGFRDSRANPRNWFSGRRARRSQEAAASADEPVNPLIPKRGEDEEGGIFSGRRRRDAPYEGTPVAVVSAFELKPVSGGGLVAVEGLTLRQGAYDVRLIPEDPDGQPVGGVLRYELRAVQPEDTPQGPERTREVLAAAFVSNKVLESTNEIRVRGAQNERVIRR